MERTPKRVLGAPVPVAHDGTPLALGRVDSDVLKITGPHVRPIKDYYRRGTMYFKATAPD